MPKRPLYWQQRSFSGGMVYRLSEFDLADNEVEWLENFDIHEVSAATKRPGFEKMNAAALAGAVQGLHEYTLEDGSQELVCVAGGTVYRWDGAAFSIIDTGLDVDDGTRVFFVQVGDLLVLLNRVDTPKIYDPALLTVTDVGGSPPVAGVGALYFNHLFLADIPGELTRVYHSETANINSGYGGVNYFFDAVAGDSSPVVSLLAREGDLIIGKRNSVSGLTGYSPRDFSQPQNQAAYSTTRGVVSRFGLVNASGVPHFLSDDGVYSIRGYQAAVEESWAIEGVFPELDPSRMDQSMVAFHRGKMQVLAFVPRYSSTNLDVALVGHSGKGRNGLASWSLYTGLSVTAMARGRDFSFSDRSYITYGEPIYLGNVDGFVYRTSGTFLDGDTVVRSVLRTTDFNFGHPHDITLLREVNMEVELGADVSGELRFQTDQQVAVGKTFSLEGAFFVMGLSLTGDDLGGRTTDRVRMQVGSRGYEHHIEVKAEDDTELRVMSLRATGYHYGRRPVSI